jgi:hypothetical protein
MHLIDDLEKKQKVLKFSLSLSIYFSFFFSCFLFISQCYFVNFTLNLGKRQERVSNRFFFFNEKIYYNSFLSFFLSFCFARTIVFNYISIFFSFLFYLYHVVGVSTRPGFSVFSQNRDTLILCFGQLEPEAGLR